MENTNRGTPDATACGGTGWFRPILVLNRYQIERILACLPRCPDAKGGIGQHKRVLPIRELAEAVASWDGNQEAYPCPALSPHGAHFHTTTMRDWLGPPRSPRKAGWWDALMDDALSAFPKRGRQHIYGARTSSGRWVYRTHRAEFHDSVDRTYPSNLERIYADQLTDKLRETFDLIDKAVHSIPAEHIERRLSEVKSAAAMADPEEAA